jgi:hypothetical protein
MRTHFPNLRTSAGVFFSVVRSDLILIKLFIFSKACMLHTRPAPKALFLIGGVARWIEPGERENKKKK